MRHLRSGLELFIGASMLLGLALASGGCATGGGPAAEPRLRSSRISGTYYASFTTRNGVSQKGTLNIVPMGKLLYWLEWRGSGNVYSGRGALAGEALLAVWGSNKSRCLAAMLDVEPDGILRGIWFRAEDRHGATSTIEALPKTPNGNDISGTFSITAQSPDSASLPRDLQVTALGEDGYRFLWKGEEQLEGRGRLTDGMILVVSSIVGSGDKCRISEMTLADDGSLSWSWLTDDSGP